MRQNFAMPLPTLRRLALGGLLAALGGPIVSADLPSLFRLDHLLIGAADLDHATEQVAAATGVRAAYGGKHPGGTHNALLSLGEHSYLELIAAQPGAGPRAFGVDFSRLGELTPVGWAVAVMDLAAARTALEKAGFVLTPAQPGSRVTPAGATLEWQTFGLAEGPDQAPFFIAWSAKTPHPATTSPAGCRLVRFTLSGPDAEKLEQLRAVLGLEVTIVENAMPSLKVELACPAGPVTFSREKRER